MNKYTSSKVRKAFFAVALFCIFLALTPIVAAVNLEKDVKWSNGSNTQVTAVAVGDVNGDGLKEIVTGGSYWDGTHFIAQLRVFNGKTMQLIKERTWDGTNNIEIRSIAIGNVDNDNRVEIVTAGKSGQSAQICVWNGANLALERSKTWQSGSNTAINSVAIGKVDLDRAVEIVTGGEFTDDGTYAQLCVLNGATLAFENVRTWGNASIYSVAIANVDSFLGIGIGGIVTGGYYMDGTRCVAQLRIWTVGRTLMLINSKTWYNTDSNAFLNTFIRSVAVGDVDNDRALEIVTGADSWDGPSHEVGELRVYSGIMLTLENSKTWCEKPSPQYTGLSRYISQVAIGNVDKDKAVEIVTGGWYAIKDYSGTHYLGSLRVLNGVNLQFEDVKSWEAGITHINSIAVANVDGDTANEVVAGGSCLNGAQLTVWGP